MNEQEIREHERGRLADLLEEHASIIGGYASTGTRAVELVALLLRLPLTRPE